MEWVFVPLGFFCLVGFIISTVMTSMQRQRQVKMVAEFNGKLLERMGSFKDFSDFLETGGGAALMASLTAERGPTGPRSGLMRAVQIGVVLIALGLGLLFLAWHFSFGTPLGNWSSAVNRELFTINGVIALSLGIGFLVAATVSYAVARNLGLLNPSEQRIGSGPIR